MSFILSLTPPLFFSVASRDVVICLHFGGATCFIHCQNLHIAFFIGQTLPRPSLILGPTDRVGPNIPP